MTSPEPHREDVPLVVDLDGTLTRTDTLYESFLLLLKRAPLLALLVPLWLLRGKAHLKAELARRALPDAALLPYHEELLAFLREERARGRRLVLATAADRRIAEAVALHLGLFDGVHASDGRENLSGGRKLARLTQALGGRFAYAGNCSEDVPLWRTAHGVVVVATAEEARRWCGGLTCPVRHFHAPAGGVRTWVKALRLHQWAKNALIFVPLVAAHRALELPLLLQAGLAFLAFGLCASSVYVLNDLLDLESDRTHPTKRRRPFAAGTLPVRTGLLLAPVLLVAAFTLASALLPPAFVALLATYYATTLAYSLVLKQRVMLDVLVLAGLYTARLFGGALAVDVPISDWLLAFSMFLFLSLALVKRLTEVRRVRAAGEAGAHGRGYLASDLEQLTGLGTASGYLAVLVLALYITSHEVTRLYSHPGRLWLLCPLLLYWVGRVWLLAGRGEVNEDPLVFALKDRLSYMVGLAAGLVLALAR